jgi:hypothetical protein
LIHAFKNMASLAGPVPTQEIGTSSSASTNAK